MKKTLSAFVVTLSAVMMLSSCLGSDDVTYYHDTAITSFSVGTLNSLVDTLSSGDPDTVSCSSYKFNIDQVNREIYNADSLPAGLDMTKVLTSISSKNGGIIGILDLDSLGNEKDGTNLSNVEYYSSSDSLDFSVPRHLYVFNNDLTAYVVYTVHVNYHKEYADSFPLHYLGRNSDIAHLSVARAIANGENLYVFGVRDNALKIYRTSIVDGTAWDEISTVSTVSADAYRNVVAKDGYLYTLSDGNVLRSSDARTWTEMGSNSNLVSLVGAGSMQLYGLSSSGFMVSKDDGTTWTDETMDADTSFLPKTNMNCICLASLTNDSTDLMTLVGNSSSQGVAVWNKVAEHSWGAESQEWSYTDATAWYESASSQVYVKGTMPDVLLAATYGGEIEGLGSDLQLYNSRDHGLTWHVDSTVSKKLSVAVGTLHSGFAFTSDQNNYLWIIDRATGNIWKGRHNKKGWSTAQTIFTK